MNQHRLLFELDRVAQRFRMLRLWQYLSAAWLIAAGLVTRQENQADRREVLIALSGAGAQLVGEVTARRRAEIAQIVEAIPPSRRRAVVTALNAFSRAADEPKPADSPTSLGW